MLKFAIMNFMCCSSLMIVIRLLRLCCSFLELKALLTNSIQTSTKWKQLTHTATTNTTKSKNTFWGKFLIKNFILVTPSCSAGYKSYVTGSVLDWSWFFYFAFRLERDLSDVKGLLADKQHQIESLQNLIQELRSQLHEMEQLQKDKDAEVSFYYS